MRVEFLLNETLLDGQEIEKQGWFEISFEELKGIKSILHHHFLIKDILVIFSDEYDTRPQHKEIEKAEAWDHIQGKEKKLTYE